MSKVLISIPDDLLAEIDRAVDRSGTSRSAFIQNAARDALRVPSHHRIEDALNRARLALRDAGAKSAADFANAVAEVAAFLNGESRQATDQCLRREQGSAAAQDHQPHQVPVAFLPEKSPIRHDTQHPKNHKVFYCVIAI